MAEIKFIANTNVGDSDIITHTEGSGLGFYGTGYGVSVPVASRQDSTWLTNGDGTENTNMKQLHNTKLDSLTEIGSSTTDPVVTGKVKADTVEKVDLTKLPNYLCPLNIRFEHTEDVMVQNCKLRIFDRNNIENHATGVVTYVYEARHPFDSPSYDGLSHRGESALEWQEFDPTEDMADMTFTYSPGSGGLNSTTADEATSATKFNTGDLSDATYLGNLHKSKRHDWYVALSAQPTEIGSKTKYGLYFTLEYL